MTQELLDLRQCILEGRYNDALAMVDELEGMSRQAILRNIQSYLLRLLIHLIKNQAEGRLSNSWAASIRDSLRQIQKLNRQDNKTSHYINPDEWRPLLEDEWEEALESASLEVQANLSPEQLLERLEPEQVMKIAEQLLQLTYDYPAKTLSGVINENLVCLPGGENWWQGRQQR